MDAWGGGGDPERLPIRIEPIRLTEWLIFVGRNEYGGQGGRVRSKVGSDEHLVTGGWIVLREDLMEYAIVCHASNILRWLSVILWLKALKKIFFHSPVNVIVDRETT